MRLCTVVTVTYKHVVTAHYNCMMCAKPIFKAAPKIETGAPRRQLHKRSISPLQLRSESGSTLSQPKATFHPQQQLGGRQGEGGTSRRQCVSTRHEEGARWDSYLPPSTAVPGCKFTSVKIPSPRAQEASPSPSALVFCFIIFQTRPCNHFLSFLGKFQQKQFPSLQKGGSLHVPNAFFSLSLKTGIVLNISRTEIRSPKTNAQEHHCKVFLTVRQTQLYSYE